MKLKNFLDLRSREDDTEVTQQDRAKTWRGHKSDLFLPRGEMRIKFGLAFITNSPKKLKTRAVECEILSSIPQKD